MATKRKENGNDTHIVCHAKKTKELSVTEIKKLDLDALGIYYSQTTTPVNEFMNMLQKDMPMIEFPEEAKWFIDLTKEHLTFSLDLDKIPDINVGAGPAVAERRVTSYLEEHSQNLQKLLETYTFGTDDCLKRRLFSDWLVSTGKFLDLTLDMVKLHILCSSSNDPYSSSSTLLNHENPTEILESVLHEVFSRFTEIFFLLPTRGRDTRKIDNSMHCVPDICYLQYTNTSVKHPVLMQHYQVKKDGLKRAKEKFVKMKKHSSMKEFRQLGVQLVSHCYNSAFIPNVLGIVSMGTQVMFVYLTMEADHINAIHNSEDVGQHRACIYYTEIFDIMQSEERNKITELLFWLGCVQKCNLHHYYLKT